MSVFKLRAISSSARAASAQSLDDGSVAAMTGDGRKKWPDFRVTGSEEAAKYLRDERYKK